MPLLVLEEQGLNFTYFYCIGKNNKCHMAQLLMPREYTKYEYMWNIAPPERIEEVTRQVDFVFPILRISKVLNYFM
jgi:hypothetical protein